MMRVCMIPVIVALMMAGGRACGLIAVLLFAAMVPMFLGLFVVLPVLGHASWHIYREVTD